MTQYVIGHLKPDTDSVVAAMALAYLYQNNPQFGYDHAVAAITETINGETEYLLNKFGVSAPAILSATDLQADDRVILVDHNEADQRLTGLQEEQIVEIIDHHKANFNFSQPIFLTFKVWGSSNSIVYYLMKKHGVIPEPKLAALMLAAILSDTVGFKSPTCTPQDEKFAKELARIAGINDLAAFTLEIFKAKSDVSKLSPEQIVKNDYKVFDFAGKKVLIDQLETVEQADILSQKKTELLSAMESVKSEMALDLIFVVITDILQVNSKLLILSDDEAAVASKAFGGKISEQVLDIGPRLSRKKEIAPPIEQALTVS
jgi:manganese-dependent inorganic pyrophosphatase